MKLDLRSFEDFKKFLEIFGPVIREINKEYATLIDIFTSEDIFEEAMRRCYEIEDLVDRNSISFKIIQDIKMNFTPEQIIESISRRFPNLKEMVYNLDEESLREFLLKMLYVDLNPVLRNLLTSFRRLLLELGAKEVEGGLLISKDLLSKSLGIDVEEDILLKI